jgi:hypothetical protein
MIKLLSALLILVLCFVFSCEDTETETNSPNRDGVNDSSDDANQGINDQNSGTDSDIDGDSDADADSDSDSDDGILIDDSQDTDEEVCAEVDFSIEPSPVRIMILQDVSGSMKQGNPPKWAQAKEALGAVLDKYSSNIQFGFDIFPNAACNTSGPLLMDTGRKTSEKIKDLLEKTTINMNGLTPLWAGMMNFVVKDYAPKFTDGKFASYLLVVSDGEDSCGLSSTNILPDGGIDTDSSKTNST